MIALSRSPVLNLDVGKRYSRYFRREVLAKHTRIAGGSLEERVVSRFRVLEYNTDISTTEWPNTDRS